MTALCALSFLALNCKMSVKDFGIVWIDFALCLVLFHCSLSTLHSSLSARTLQAQIEHFAGVDCNVQHFCRAWETRAYLCLQTFCLTPFQSVYWLSCLMICHSKNTFQSWNMPRKFWPVTWTEDHPVVQMHLAYLKFRSSYNWALVIFPTKEVIWFRKTGISIRMGNLVFCYP